MFAKKSKDKLILELLAKAYSAYELVDWDYARADADAGGFLVDKCITNSEKFEFIVDLIGQGLLEENDNAINACLLFEKLYKNGFKNGQFHKPIQEKFKELLPQASIDRLDEGAPMEACLKSIHLYESTMRVPG